MLLRRRSGAFSAVRWKISMTHASCARRITSLGAAALIGVASCGCALVSGGHSSVRPLPDVAAPAAKPAPPTEPPTAAFLTDPSRMVANPAYPFARSWVDPSVDFTSFRTIVIAPISLAYLRPVPAGVASHVDAHGRREAALEAAIRVPDAFASAVAQGRTLKIGGNTGANTVVASMAIVQLVPNLAARDAGQSGAQLLLGTTATQMSQPIAVEPGEIAMDTILSDGGSGKVIAMFADTQQAEISRAATAPPSEYGFAGPAIDGWAQKLVRVISNTVGIGSAGAAPH
jgi:Protein of unknown function (DUF3313)